MSGEKGEVRTSNSDHNNDEEDDSEDSLSELDIWKPPSKALGHQIEDEPSSSNLFQKKFKEIRCIEEQDLKSHLDAKHEKNTKRRMRRKRKRAENKPADSQSSQENAEDESKWQKIRPFMAVYDHIHGPVGHGKYGPKTELEYEIDDALANDDIEKAESLSQKISTREFGVKVNRAFAAKRAWDKKVLDDKLKTAKKKKRLPWGFEAKERWQMKGNM